MKSLIPAIVLVATAALSAEDAAEIRLIQYRVGASLSDAVPFEVKPMGHEYGAELAFLIKGAGLVSIMEDSAVMAKLTSRDGKDLAKTPSGKPAWEIGPFPKVSSDGDYASFTLKSRGKLMGRLEGAEAEGSVVLLMGGQTDQGDATVSKGADPVEIGPFKVSIGKAGGGIFGSGDGGTAIKVVGNHQSIIEITAMDGDKELDSSGSSWSGNSRSYAFDKAEGDEIRIKISYWKDLKEVRVPFKMVVGG